MKRLINIYAAIASNDVEPYLLVRFLEQEFKKKDLGNIFDDPTGGKYPNSYFKALRNGHAKPTNDLLNAIRAWFPNFDEDYETFVWSVYETERHTIDELGQNNERDTKLTKQKEMLELKKSTLKPQTGFALFLTKITGLNVAQIQHIMKEDPNRCNIKEDGKRSIPANLIDNACEAFDITPEDFKEFKKDRSYADNYSNETIKELRKEYLVDVQ